MIDLVKEFDEIRNRLARIRDILDEQGLFEKADQTSVNDAQKLHDYWSSRVTEQRESILKSAAGTTAYEPGETAMRLVLPLDSFDEQIAAMTRRLLQAADTLSAHSLRVLGPQPCERNEGMEELLRDRPAGALDRLAERLNELTGAVIYVEGEVNRATGLA